MLIFALCLLRACTVLLITDMCYIDLFYFLLAFVFETSQNIVKLAIIAYITHAKGTYKSPIICLLLIYNPHLVKNL